MRYSEAPGWSEALAQARATHGFPPAIYERVAAGGFEGTWPFPLPLQPDVVVSYAAICVRHSGIHCTGAQRRLANRVLRRVARGAKSKLRAQRRAHDLRVAIRYARMAGFKLRIATELPEGCPYVALPNGTIVVRSQADALRAVQWVVASHELKR